MTASHVFLDVNVFMYAAGTPHPLKPPCLRILADVESGALAAAINTDIIQEVLYRYSHIGRTEAGLALSREILRYPLIILPIRESEIRLAIEIFDAYHRYGIAPRDAVHAATAQLSGMTRMVSTDVGFDRFDFLTRIDPATYPLGL